MSAHDFFTWLNAMQANNQLYHYSSAVRRAPEPRFERARSGRAGCRCCGQKIQKQVVRLSVMKPYQQHFTDMWFHATCACVRKGRDCVWCGKKEATGLVMPDAFGGTAGRNRAFCFECYFRKVAACAGGTAEKHVYFDQFKAKLEQSSL